MRRTYFIDIYNQRLEFPLKAKFTFIIAINFIKINPRISKSPTNHNDQLFRQIICAFSFQSKNPTTSQKNYAQLWRSKSLSQT